MPTGSKQARDVAPSGGPLLTFGLSLIGAGVGTGLALLVYRTFFSESKKPEVSRVPQVQPVTPIPQPKPARGKAADENEEWDSWDARNSVTVRVPATSANLGSGFDTIGIALDMWSEISVERAEKFSMTCEGEGADELPLDETNLVCFGVKRAFEYVGEEVPPLKYHCINRIPYGRGLGSSSAAIVGGLIAGLALCGKELQVYGEHSLSAGGERAEPEELLQLACEIEGHPDNVTPAIYGGIQLGIKTGDDRWRSSRVNCPPLTCS